MVNESNGCDGIAVNEISVRGSIADNQKNDATVESSDAVGLSSAVEIASDVVSNALIGAFNEIEWSHQSNLEQGSSKLVFCIHSNLTLL